MMDVENLQGILRESSASHEFKAAVRALEAGDLDHVRRRVEFNPGEPTNKVLCVLVHLVKAHPDLPVESATVEADAEASVEPTIYKGQLIVQPGRVRFYFSWDCKWKAEKLGWLTPAGCPDHARAARELGCDCFRLFERIE
jgi:hypothetical protein